MAKKNVSMVDTDCSEMSVKKKTTKKPQHCKFKTLIDIQNHSFLEVCPVIVPEKTCSEHKSIFQQQTHKINRKKEGFGSLQVSCRNGCVLSGLPSKVPGVSFLQIRKSLASFASLKGC